MCFVFEGAAPVQANPAGGQRLGGDQPPRDRCGEGVHPRRDQYPVQVPVHTERYCKRLVDPRLSMESNLTFK